MRIGLGIGINKPQGRRGPPSFTPASLFASGEQGARLEAPTLDTLYTDDAGTTQATVGDTMALWSDGSGNGNDAVQSDAAARMLVSGTGPYYLTPDGSNDNFEIPLGAGFTGDFCLILDTGPIFGSIDTGASATWNYTVNPAYIPDGNIHALIVVDRAFTATEKQALVDHYADAVTSTPSTADNAFRDRTDLTALDTSYGDWTGVTKARFTFRNCPGLTTPPDVSGWTGVTKAGSAFQNCSGLTSAINLDNWNPTILTDGTNMMLGISAAGFDQTAYDSALTAWGVAYDLTTVNAINIHFGSAEYGSGAPTTAHDTLVAAGWTITDGGAAP